jgi:hypothetical protein
MLALPAENNGEDNQNGVNMMMDVVENPVIEKGNNCGIKTPQNVVNEHHQQQRGVLDDEIVEDITESSRAPTSRPTLTGSSLRDASIDDVHLPNGACLSVEKYLKVYCFL